MTIYTNYNGGMLDQWTEKNLRKLMLKGVIGDIISEVGVGKESRVYLALTPKNEKVAVKIFFPQSISFKKHKSYILGDHRFKSFRNNPYQIVKTWCSKEFRNLKRCFKAGVTVPEPLAFEGNILVMEFIGEMEPAPLLKDLTLEKPREVLIQLIENIRKLWQKARLVHGDLSEYNVMVWCGKAYIIDWSSALERSHPRAFQLLIRDLKNILNYFEGNGVIVDFNEVLEYVTGV